MSKATQSLQDKHEGSTFIGMFGLILTVGVCGFAVDIRDGFRNRTMLHATADVAALDRVAEATNDVPKI